MTKKSAQEWGSLEDAAKNIAQAKALRDQARNGGLRFEAYLPPGLADWLLARIERGALRDPSEAAFVMLGEQAELESHDDLRRELLRRSLQTAIDDPRPGIPAEEVFERLREKFESPIPERAVWRRES